LVIITDQLVLFGVATAAATAFAFSQIIVSPGEKA